MHFDKRIPLMIELGFSESEIPRLKKYIDLLWASNEELNLISRKMTFEELIDNHLIDCLLPLKKFPHVKVAADFGSGGGLPGVVYAIQFPKTTYHLFEKSPKKQEFLRKCQAIAPNLKVNGEIPLDLKDIEIVSARAFKPVDVILDMSRNYFAKGGKYFLLKGRKEKIDEEMALAQKKFKTVTAQIETLHSPLLEVERHLVLIP
ncbi:ribosomal RNA small subunit methyltransferase G 1 [Bdellovibrio bacteriovorus]|uniref:Ribosomal RNA small subunit methyltransferase G n=1 Tax=Bdellovibrio bacteriovorus TaxID=959 RepID=A0A150WRG5_BDEBC|nr:RsmG family class I SAM-dependent methyltransferase [Bdellovibrio bacteriovorus]KYG66976.1 ribosomal RNA small subunit methyltransferase G 1 [Bdellovibrio bacteriovorus]